MPSLSLRIDLDADGRIGPGKVELLEQIAAHGSISGRRARRWACPTSTPGTWSRT